MQRFSAIKSLSLCLAVMLGGNGLAHAQATKTSTARKTIDVRHWWISIADAEALQFYKENLSRRNIDWHDSGVDGEQSKDLKERARNAKGKIPDAAQMKNADARLHADSGLLMTLDEVATRENWANVVPKAIQGVIRPKGQWIGVASQIHRSNAIWINKKIFDKLNLAPPKTFEEMVKASKVLRNAGYIPLAHGGEAWQDAVLLENAILSAGGPKFYQQVLVNFDQKALRSKTMEKAFEYLDAMRGMVDANSRGRGWFFASALVARDKAGMQVMGDWAKHEFVAAGKKPNVDFYCLPFPGTTGSFVYVTDLFGLFKKDDGNRDVQLAFASIVMDKKVQETFSLAKGSIPVRTDIALTRFDACAQATQSDMKEAEKRNTLIPRFTLEIESRPDGIIAAAAHNFMQSAQSPREAAKRLADELQYLRKGKKA